MTTHDKKKALLEKLLGIWDKNPSMRFGQFIECVASLVVDPDIYYVDDKTFSDWLTAYDRKMSRR